MEHTHDLPDGMVEWIAETGGGKITALHRHVARREAWVVDVTRPDGSVLKGFLRLERTPAGPKSSTSLTRETRIIQALAQTDIPVPEVYGVSQELNCTLFERVRGRSDIDKLDDPAQQRAVMEDFIRVIARLHTLDLADLGLDDVMPYLPTTPQEAALNDVDLALERREHVHVDAQRLAAGGGFRVVEPDALDEAAVARVARVGNHHVVEGPVLGATAGQTNNNHWELQVRRKRKARIIRTGPGT